MPVWLFFSMQSSENPRRNLNSARGMLYGACVCTGTADGVLTSVIDCWIMPAAGTPVGAPTFCCFGGKGIWRVQTAVATTTARQLVKMIAGLCFSHNPESIAVILIRLCFLRIAYTSFANRMAGRRMEYSSKYYMMDPGCICQAMRRKRQEGGVLCKHRKENDQISYKSGSIWREKAKKLRQLLFFCLDEKP